MEAQLQSLPLQTKVPPSCTLAAHKLLLFAQPRDSLYQHSGTQKHDMVMWHHTLIFIKDPIGSSPPNIPIKEKFSHMGSMKGNALAMSCPAQGFPVPAFRYSKPCPNFNCSLSHTNSEPVGSSAPKTSIKLDSVQSSDKHALSLSCPAQGFPLPAFR